MDNYTEINFNYKDFRKEVVVSKINKEMIFLETNSVASTELSEYIIYLKSRIGSKFIKKNITIPYYITNHKKLNMPEHLKYLDTMTYQKPWCRMKDIHKNLKVTEFVSSLEYPKAPGFHQDGDDNDECIKNNREYIKNKLMEGIRAKKFGKNKAQLDYDVENMKINSVDCVVYNKNTGIYEIDWD